MTQICDIFFDSCTQLAPLIDLNELLESKFEPKLEVQHPRRHNHRQREEDEEEQLVQNGRQLAPLARVPDVGHHGGGRRLALKLVSVLLDPLHGRVVLTGDTE